MNKKLVVSLLAVVTLVMAGPSPGWAQKGPIKIGFLTPMTGGGAAVGKDMTNGFTMYLEEIGSQIAGRKVEVIVEDTQGTSPSADQAAQAGGERQRPCRGRHLFAHVGYALAPKVDEYRIPTVYPVVSADDLTQRKPAKWVVRTGWTSSQPNHPFGEYVAKTLGYKRIVTIAIDYAFGWEQVGGFQTTFEEAGGQIVQKLWPPLGTTDFGPYLAQIKRDADAVFAVMVAVSASASPSSTRTPG